MDGIDTGVMSWCLRELKGWLREGEEAWVVLDRAGWHVSPKVEVPEGGCLVLQNNPHVVRQHTLFHWWPVGKELV